MKIWDDFVIKKLCENNMISVSRVEVISQLNDFSGLKRSC